MRRIPRRLSLLLLPLVLLSTQARAGVKLTVDGVEDPLKAAAIAGVELSQYTTREVSDAQVRRLYERAPGQVKSALEPYGYYDATVTGDLQQVGKDWQVTLHVQPGEPVKVTAVDVQLDKEAAQLAPLRRAKRAIERLKDKPLNHGAYDAARATDRADARGGLIQLQFHRRDLHRLARLHVQRQHPFVSTRQEIAGDGGIVVAVRLQRTAHLVRRAIHQSPHLRITDVARGVLRKIHRRRHRAAQWIVHAVDHQLHTRLSQQGQQPQRQQEAQASEHSAHPRWQPSGT
jgi:hypothetical protein